MLAQTCSTGCSNIVLHVQVSSAPLKPLTQGCQQMQWPPTSQPICQAFPLHSLAGEKPLAPDTGMPGFPTMGQTRGEIPRQQQHLQQLQQPSDAPRAVIIPQLTQLDPQVGRGAASAWSSPQHPAQYVFAADLAGRPDLRASVCSSTGSYYNLADRQSHLSQSLQQHRQAASLTRMQGTYAAGSNPLSRSPGSLAQPMAVSVNPASMPDSNFLDQPGLAPMSAAAASQISQSQMILLSQRHGSVQQPVSGALLSRQSWQGPVLTWQQHQATEHDEPSGPSQAWPGMTQPQGVLTAQQQNQQAPLQLHHAQPAHRIQFVEAPVVQGLESALPLQPSQRQQQQQLLSQLQHGESIRSGHIPGWGQREALPAEPDPAAHLHQMDTGWPFDAGSPLASAGRPSLEPVIHDPAISSSDQDGSQQPEAGQDLPGQPGTSPDPDMPSQAEESQAGPRLRRVSRSLLLLSRVIPPSMDTPSEQPQEIPEGPCCMRTEAWHV